VSSRLGEEQWLRRLRAGDGEAGLRLSELLQIRGENGYAEEVLRHTARGSGPVAARAAFALGLLLVERGYPGEAHEAFRAANNVADAGDSPDVVLNLAARWAALGRRSDAKQAYRSVVQHAPDRRDRALAAFRLSSLELEDDNCDAAIDLLRLAAADGMEDLAPVAKLELGRALGDESTEQREALYREVVESDHPDCAPEAAVRLSELLTNRGEVAEAHRFLDLAIASEHPEWADVATDLLKTMKQDLVAESLRSAQGYRRLFISSSGQLYVEPCSAKCDLVLGNPRWHQFACGDTAGPLTTNLAGDCTSDDSTGPTELEGRMGFAWFVPALALLARRFTSSLLKCVLPGSHRLGRLSSWTSLERRIRDALVHHGLTAAEAARTVSLYAALRTSSTRRECDRAELSRSIGESRPYPGASGALNAVVGLMKPIPRLIRRELLRLREAWIGSGSIDPASYLKLASRDLALLRSTLGVRIAMSGSDAGKGLLALHTANLVQHELIKELHVLSIRGGDEGLGDHGSALELDNNDPGVSDWQRCQYALSTVFGESSTAGAYLESVARSRCICAHADSEISGRVDRASHGGDPGLSTWSFSGDGTDAVILDGATEQPPTRMTSDGRMKITSEQTRTRENGRDGGLVTGSKPSTLKQELIPDRSLGPDDEDEFAHDDYVDQLEALIDSRPNMANIALFGSWGAGKSGIATRLRERCKKQGLLYAEFNALKYAKAPLLRHFVAAIAREVLPTKDAAEFRARLYRQKTSSNIEIPKGWKSAFKSLFWLLAGIILVDVLLLLLLEGKAHELALDINRALLPTAIPVAALTIVAARVLPFLTVTTKRDAPASEEEFEEEFRCLVEDKLKIEGGDDRRRLIVFIDELDRCSPQQVVDTLETLRTFVDRPGCIFIVAADQQVLEHALTLRVRQATPADPSNPYYSAGSAYLDKIFDYQFGLPPLLPGRLVDYALKLVKDRAGVWQELEDLDDIIPVLLPVHVRSPRRVKVLLNRFALSYAIAKKRQEAGKLSGLEERAVDLAKLVCLRTEFPLFASDLDADWRLSDVILRARDSLDQKKDPMADPYLKLYDEHLIRRAVLYAEGRLPVAEEIGEERLLLEEPAGELIDDEQQVGPQEGQAEVADETAESESRTAVSRKASAAVSRAHALQLINYLQKTRDIEGPGRDLVHLEGSGAVVGIDPAVAQRIELEALNNRSEQVADMVAALETEGSQEGALRVLGDLLRSSRGNDADNVVRALLRAAGSSRAPLGRVAGRLAGDLEHFERRRGFAAAELPGILKIAIVASNERLTNDVMEREELRRDGRLRAIAIELADRLEERHGDQVARVVADSWLDDPADLQQQLNRLDSDLGETLLVAAGELVRADLEASSTAHRDAPDEAKDETFAVARDSLAKAVELPVALGDAEQRRHAELALVPIIGFGNDNRELYSQVADTEQRLAPFETAELSRAVLRDVSNWSCKSWPGIIERLSLESLDEQELAEAGDRLGARLWSRSEKDPDVNVAEAVEAIKLLGSPGSEQFRKTSDVIQGAITEGSEGAGIQERDRQLERTGVFAAAGIVDRKVLSSTTLDLIVKFVKQDLAAGTDADEAYSTLRRWAKAAVGADPEEIVAARAALGESTWLGSPRAEILGVDLTASLPRGHAERTYAGSMLRELADSWGDDALPAVAVWLQELRPDPNEVREVIARWEQDSLPEVLAEPLAIYTEGLDGSELAELAAPSIERALEAEPSSAYLASVRLQEAEEARIVPLILKLGGEAGNQSEREIVLRMWTGLAPQEDALRRRLIREVLLPMAEEGAVAWDLVRRNLKLAVPPPHGTKQELVERLMQLAPDEERAKTMERRMVEVGLLPKKEKKRRRWLF
jgi:tetratricopeptide (TPR) repeat protein